MTGLNVFLTLDAALLAAFIHWRVWHAAPRRRSAPPARDLQAFCGSVFVIDGDTIVVNRTGVRLFGMDAPEMSQRGGDRAKAHLKRMAGGREVRVLPVAVDCYGRVVGRVLLGEIDLSHAMVREGFAVAMRAYHADYVAAEDAARAERRGLWAEGGIGDPAAHRRGRAGRRPRPAPAREDVVVPFSRPPVR